MRLREEEEEEKERGIVNITRLLAAALHSTAGSPPPAALPELKCLIRPSSLAALPVQSYLEPGSDGDDLVSSSSFSL